MVAAKPTDIELTEKIRALVPKVDLQTMGLKTFLKLLSKEMGGVDLKPRKEFIKKALTEAINEAGDDSESEESEEEEDEESEEEVSTPKKRKVGGGGGLAQRKDISKKLAAFLGKGTTMARTEIVKELWVYIRENNLQNPSNKREIILDEAMREVFDCKMFTMFTMNKYISAHVDPFKPVDLTPTPKSTTKTKRKTKDSGSAKKKRKVGTQPPYRLSQELQDIVGTDILPRPQVVSKIWVYIKANNLQNENDKREIICDEKLKKIMKTSKISMFQMNVHIGAHLLEKLDKSEYQHDVASDAGSDSD